MISELIKRKRDTAHKGSFHTTFEVMRTRHLQRLSQDRDLTLLRPTRSNLFVRILSHIQKDSDIFDLEDIFNQFNLPTIDRYGEAVTNVFNGGKTQEVIILDTNTSYSADGTIVEVAHYPFSGLVAPTPNGRNKDSPDGIAVYIINGNQLLREYHAYRQSIPKDKTHNNRYFIYTHITEKLLNTITDISIFNTYLNLMTGDFSTLVEAEPTLLVYKPYLKFYSIAEHILSLDIKNHGKKLEDILNAVAVPLTNGLNAATSIAYDSSPRYQWLNMYVTAHKLAFFIELNKTMRIPWLEKDLRLFRIHARYYRSISSSMCTRIPADIRLDVSSYIANL